jgi:hypothetical protein
VTCKTRRFVELALALVLTNCGKVDNTLDASTDSGADAVLQDASFDVPNVPFTCGTLTCQSSTQFCEHIHHEAAPDGSIPESFDCRTLVDPCHSCACLKDAGFPGMQCTCQCVISPTCSDDGGLINVDHDCY